MLKKKNNSIYKKKTNNSIMKLSLLLGGCWEVVFFLGDLVYLIILVVRRNIPREYLIDNIFHTSPRKKAPLKGNDLRELDPGMLDHFGEDSHAHFWGEVRYTSQFRRENYHMPDRVECWQIFQGGLHHLFRKNAPSEKYNPSKLCWTCKIHAWGRQFSGSHRFGTTVCFHLSFSAIPHEFPLATVFCSLPPWQSVLTGGPFWVPLSLWDDV